VDFRTDYPRAFHELLDRLEEPAPVGTPVPQAGFAAPPQVWLALVLSLIVLIGSFPAWWTLVLPYVLVPLPRQILQRSYVLHRVVPLLLILPPVYWLSWWLMFTSRTSIFYEYRGFVGGWFPLSLLSGLVLAGLLLTPAMQRRGLPQAARMRFANPLMPVGEAPRPVRFSIDHALEDGRYVEELARGLEKNGHIPVSDEEGPEAVFVLMSTYKTRTDHDTQHEAVYPILLQAVREIDPALQRIQWIDFRSGLRQLDTLARLLPQPARLLKGLAVPPSGAQEVYPVMVSALQTFVLATGLLQGGGLLLSLVALLVWLSRGNSAYGAGPQILGVVLSGFVLLGTTDLSARALRSRAEGASALYPLLVLTLLQVLIGFLSILVIGLYWQSADTEAEVRLLWLANRASAVNWFVLPVALLILVTMLILRWRELYRWLPRRQDDPVSELEEWLLLYAPSRRAALILHILFHGLFLFLYVFLSLWSLFAGWWFAPYFLICAAAITVVMLGIRYWARRLAVLRTRPALA
jgi:hypothetical protein